MPWVTHPPADFTQWKQLTASCWDQSQVLNKAGCWEGGKERMDCPWHSGTNIWTHGSFSNRKAGQNHESLRCGDSSSSTTEWLVAQGWHPWGICVCALTLLLVWGRAWGANLSSCPSAAFPSCRHGMAQEGFEGRSVKTKGTSCPGMAARKLLCVCWHKPAKMWILVCLQREAVTLIWGTKLTLNIFWTFLSYLTLF